jgi:uncharacterized integral membrane protein (TIGR00698 family)
MTRFLDKLRLQHWRELFPGLMASAIVAAAAAFLAEHYATPVMLLALLLGMAMGFLADADSRSKAGIEFAARSLLRLGVALLGIRLTVGQMLELGWEPLLLVISSVVLIILISVAVAKRLGFDPLFGMLTGGATAICGASAALALAAALPAHPNKERAALFTVIGVSALSTLAMISYPMLASAFGLSATEAGIFLGATIHDVAQVVGAGYSMGHETGDTATVVKLMRVAMLVPVIVVAVLITRARGVVAGAERPPLLPGFVVGFLALAALNSTGLIPASVQNLGNELSRIFLVTAIAALGMKTQLKELVKVGLKPVLLMIGETVLLAGGVIAYLLWAR